MCLHVRVCLYLLELKQDVPYLIWFAFNIRDCPPARYLSALLSVQKLPASSVTPGTKPTSNSAMTDFDKQKSVFQMFMHLDSYPAENIFFHYAAGTEVNKCQLT